MANPKLLSLLEKRFLAIGQTVMVGKIGLARIEGIAARESPGKSGKVTLRWSATDTVQEFYPNVIGAVILTTYAWTGGDSPNDIRSISEEELALAYALYHDQVDDYTTFWGTEPELGIRRTYWNRARHDAYATFRTRENRNV